jgi:3-oxoacyl-[acyl-carrier-protein] synthase-3
MKRYAHIVGWGKSVPEKILTNNDLSQMVDTSDEWILTRTGIRERHIVAEHESTASLSIAAAQEALRVADADPAKVDLIIVGTVTPEHSFPATACLVQDALGARQAAAFDLSAGCTGFVYALSMASHAIECGAYQLALVIGAETLSRIVDWTDRRTCVLFGDGAGAVVLQASEHPGGVLSSVLGADGSGGELLMLPGGGSRFPSTLESVTDGMHYLQMDGRRVYRFATRAMARAARQALEKADLSIQDLSLLIPHQANQRIIDSAARGLKLEDGKVFVNLDRYGNTSSASVPIALCEAVESGQVKRDDTLVLVAFGAGLTWAAAAVRWSMPLPVAPSPRWRVSIRWARYRWAAIRRRALGFFWRLMDRLLSLWPRRGKD